MDAKNIVEKLIEEQPTIAKKKHMAKILGVEFQHPSVKDQVHMKGALDQTKRASAKNAREMFVIPEVYLSSGRIIPELQVDPSIARETALELLRLADLHKR